MQRILGHFGCGRSDILALAEVQFGIGSCPSVNGSGKAGLACQETGVLYQDFLLKVLQMLPGTFQHCFVVADQVYTLHLCQKLGIQFR